MSSLVGKLRTEAQLAVLAADQFLIERQGGDGHWRDYNLEPGRSESWITGCVGYALCHCGPAARPQCIALHRAEESLLASRRSGGWGYNRQTACDADSTSWVIRFLAQVSALKDISALSLLSKYITPTGSVHTFGTPDRFGSWAMEHEEVAPLVGLALLAAGEHQLAAQVRASVLSTWIEGYGWKPFWWRSSAYALAQNLEFLSASGGIPKDLAADEFARLHCASAPESAFEAAQRLSSAVHLDDLVRDTALWRVHSGATVK